MTTEAKERGPWETESGLIEDVDATIRNPHFGIKEEYAAALVASADGMQKGIMLLVDLVDDEGVTIGNQGYSIGTGWTVSEDGLSITHAKRKNVVTSTLYGALQVQVVNALGVDMSQYGLPTDAMSWDGLKFHWMQLPHKTVSGQEKTGLMPTIFYGKVGADGQLEGAQAEEAAPAAAAPAPAPVAKPLAAKPVAAAKPVSKGMQAALDLVAQTGTPKEFILKAMKNPDITADEALMASCLDDSVKGFYKTHKAK